VEADNQIASSSSTKIVGASVTIPASAALTWWIQSTVGHLAMSSATTIPSGKGAGWAARPIRIYEISSSGKLQHLARVTGFFASLGIAFPAFTTHFIGGLEFVGGLQLIAGLASRLIGFLLAVNMFVACWTADHQTLASIFSDPGRLYGADLFTFLFASLMVLIFGTGFSVDAAITKHWRKRA
jgi:putative oxidoreductase